MNDFNFTKYDQFLAECDEAKEYMDDLVADYWVNPEN